MNYRYEHFERRLMLEDSGFGSGPAPGDDFPDFDLPTTDGGRIRREDLLGRPFLMINSSFT